MFIALTGRHGVGKTTVSNILRYMGFERRSFADPLKKTLSIITRIDMFCDENKSRIYEPLGITYAQLLVRYGQGMKEIMYPNIWIDLFFENAVNKWNVVCDDLYSREEYNNVKAHKGYVVCIHGPSFSKDDRSDVIDLPYDYVIENNKDYDHLVEQVKELVNKLSQKHID